MAEVVLEAAVEVEARGPRHQANCLKHLSALFCQSPLRCDSIDNAVCTDARRTCRKAPISSLVPLGACHGGKAESWGSNPSKSSA